MTIRYYPIPYDWAPLSIKNEYQKKYIEVQLKKCFEEWEGTPYMSGNQCPGAGVDCVRWVTAVLDHMYERPPTDIKTLPSDGSFHNKRGAMRAMIHIKRLYPHCTVVKDTLQPGDLLIVGPPGGGPGHAMLVGIEPNTLWHCTPNSGVVKTGWALVVGNQQIFRVYRAKDRAILWT